MIPMHSTPGVIGSRWSLRIAVGLILGCAPCSAADLAAALADPAAAVGAAAVPPAPAVRTPPIDPATTGPDAESILASLLPPRTDSPSDWFAPLETLHACGEPRVLPPCVPPPPCHPALPPQPFDLVGVRGEPTCGPIYGGPCAPRTGRHDGGRLPLAHRVPDRFFDWFYRSR